MHYCSSMVWLLTAQASADGPEGQNETRTCSDLNEGLIASKEVNRAARVGPLQVQEGILGKDYVQSRKLLGSESK